MNRNTHLLDRSGGRRLWASDSYGFVLAAHADQSQGRPRISTSSQLKGIRRPAHSAHSREAPTSEAADATNHTGRQRQLHSRAFSYRYIAGWGEDGALDAIREYAQTIDTIARRIEDTLDPKPEPADDAVAVEALAALAA
jgi:hypothetical protein